MSAKFFEKAKELTGALSQIQVNSINAIFNEIKIQGITRPIDIAYIFATAWHESRFKPIIEQGGLAYLKSKKYYPHFGRGFVQLTWLENYKKMQKILQKSGRFDEVDIINFPAQLLRIDVAAFVLVYGMKHGTFTGKKLGDYSSFKGMRAIVNGTDRAALITSYANKFLQVV